MANIERIVNIQIALNTAGISKLGFSTMLIAGVHACSVNRVETVTGIDDVTSLGFAITDPIYLACKAAFSQTPRPKNVKIGRFATKTATVTIDEATNSGVYTITATTMNAETTEITDEIFTYTNNVVNADTTTIATAVKGKITSSNFTVVNTANTLTFTFNGNTALKVSSNMTMKAGDSVDTISEDMAKIKAEDNDFYGVILADRTQSKIMEMADYAETQTKLFVTATAEKGAYTAASKTDTLALLDEKNYYRTACYPHKLAATEYVDAGVMARCFAIDPGGETWALKSLGGITADGWSETEFNAIVKKNGNTFEKVRNVTVTQNGKVAAGEWIDVIRFRDWLQEEMATNIFTTLKNANKIDYTDAGIAIIEGQIRKTLQYGQDKHGIAPTEYDSDGNENPGFTVEVPLSSEISANQKASRVLTDCKFTARLAGAIHIVNVNGSFTYESLTTTDKVSA